MPRPADPAVRDKLLATAAEVLAAEGPKALTTRRLASEAGTSTMALYTYFGGMDQLRRDLRREGFDRVCAAIDDAPATDDPVADLAGAIRTYVSTGTDDPVWYRALFVDLPPASDDDAGSGVHQRLVALVDRCADAGRFAHHEPELSQMWAAELWLAAHGIVNLAQSRFMLAEPTRYLLSDMLYRLAVGFGDQPDLARSSIDSTIHSASTRNR